MTGRGLLAGVLLLAACRTDVFVPPEPGAVGPDEPILSGAVLDVPAWEPVVRVIDANGEFVEDARVEISNRDYYGIHPELQPFEATRRESFSFWASDPPADRSIHPPFRLEVGSIPGTFDWRESGLVPAPGDTIVVDFRRASHTLDLDYEVLPPWGAPEVVVSSRVSLSVPPLLESDRTMSDTRRVEGLEPGEYPLYFGPQTRELSRIELTWSSRAEGPLVTGAARRLDAIYAIRDVESDVGTGDTFEVDAVMRSFELQIVAGDEPLDAVPVRVSMERNVDETFWSSRGEAIASDVPISFYTFEGEATLTVQRTTDRLHFFERKARIATDDGDTVTVDVGTYRLRARVVDAAGDPIPDVPVRFRRAHGSPWRESIDHTTDATGVVEIRAMDGFYRVEFGVDAENPTGSRILAVREDTEVEFTWDR